jgi:hypothetical protein
MHAAGALQALAEQKKAQFVGGLETARYTTIGRSDLRLSRFIKEEAR